MPLKPPKAAVVARDVPEKTGTRYPAPLDAVCKGRGRRALGNFFGLTNCGVNVTRIPPGEWSAHRHWHSAQDEFVYMLEGELLLVTDDGAQTLTAGMCVGFPKGAANAHCLKNMTDKDAVYLEIGDRSSGDAVEYPDVDLALTCDDQGRFIFTHKDGTAYE